MYLISFISLGNNSLDVKDLVKLFHQIKGKYSK